MRKAIVLSALILAATTIAAQVPVNVLYRVIRIKTVAALCSAFTIDLATRQYLVTARHCVKDFTRTATVDWWHDQGWTRLEGALVLPRNPDVDIAAIALEKPITLQYPLEATLDQVELGQQVYFVGYPFGLSTRGAIPAPQGFGEVAFLKSGILSAMDARNVDAVVLYIDGQNNLGFSGGPIVFRASGSAAFRVGGVISGYRNEPLPVLKRKDLGNPQAQAYEDLFTRANSGIVVGYSIEHIVKAISEAAR